MNDKQTRRTPDKKPGTPYRPFFGILAARYRFLYHGFVLSADVGNFLDAAGCRASCPCGKPFLP